ncbi:MAG TPA: hypothetical protein VF885_19320 [Arthrobacter sp.]
MFPDPSCTRCKTSDYLLIHGHRPATSRQRRYDTAQGPIFDVEKEDAEATFHCMKCGLFNGHTVSDAWRPIKLSSEKKEEVLGLLGKEQGFSFPAVGTRNEYDSRGRVVAQKHGHFQ